VVLEVVRSPWRWRWNLKNENYHGLGNTRPRCTNTAERAQNMSIHHDRVSVPVCTVSFEWNMQTNPYHSDQQLVETTGWRCRWNIKNENYHGLGNTRARRTNTAEERAQTCSCTMATCPYPFVLFPWVEHSTDFTCSWSKRSKRTRGRMSQRFEITADTGNVHVPSSTEGTLLNHFLPTHTHPTR
jgi:hypothetical protein